MRPDHEVRERDLNRAELEPGVIPDLLLSPGALPRPRSALRHGPCWATALPTPSCPASGRQVPRPLLSHVTLGSEPISTEPVHPGLRHHSCIKKCGSSKSQRRVMLAQRASQAMWPAECTFCLYHLSPSIWCKT